MSFQPLQSSVLFPFSQNRAQTPPLEVWAQTFGCPETWRPTKLWEVAIVKGQSYVPTLEPG